MFRTTPKNVLLNPSASANAPSVKVPSSDHMDVENDERVVHLENPYRDEEDAELLEIVEQVKFIDIKSTSKDERPSAPLPQQAREEKAVVAKINFNCFFAGDGHHTKRRVIENDSQTVFTYEATT